MDCFVFVWWWCSRAVFGPKAQHLIQNKYHCISKSLSPKKPLWTRIYNERLGFECRNKIEANANALKTSINDATNTQDHNLEIFPSAFHLLSTVLVVVIVSLHRFFFTFAVRLEFLYFILVFPFIRCFAFLLFCVDCRSMQCFMYFIEREKPCCWLLLTVVTIAVAIYSVFGIKY